MMSTQALAKTAAPTTSKRSLPGTELKSNSGPRTSGAGIGGGPSSQKSAIANGQTIQRARSSDANINPRTTSDTEQMRRT